MSLPAIGPVGPLSRERTEDRAATRLPSCWVHEGAGGALPPSAALVPLASAGSAEPALPPSTETPVLFMLAERPPPVALSALLRAADRGHRVYVLATTGFGEGQRDPGLRDRGRARMLVRRVPDLPASALLHDRGQTGVAWIGPSGADAPSWALPLSPEQGAGWFQVFLQLFWHHAADEAWTTLGGLRFQPAAERPFDVPTPSGGPRLASPADVLECPAGSSVYLPEGAPPGPPLARLLVPPSGRHHPALAAQVRAGAAACWRDLGLPFAVLALTGATLAPRSQTTALHLPLSPEQAAALRGLFEAVEAAPAWRFQVNPTLGELPDRPVWLPDAPAALEPVARVDLSAPAAQAAALRDMATAPPPSWPSPPPLARLARTSWQVLPPRSPKGGAEDPLVAAWRTLDADVARRVVAAREGLAEAEGLQGRIGAAFQALMGALLGFGRKRATLGQDLDGVAAPPPSARGPEGARLLLGALTRVETEVAQLRDDLGTTERKALEDAERRRQEAAHDKAVREARQQLAERRGEQRNKRARHDELTRKLRDLEVAGDPASERDLEATRKRWKDELSGLNRRLQAIEAELSDLEQRASAAFEFKPLATPPRPAGPTAHAFVPKATPRTGITVPDEAPPAVGELLRQGGQRYLVVKRWEDLDRAEEEGVRLGARLVAPMEGV